MENFVLNSMELILELKTFPVKSYTQKKLYKNIKYWLKKGKKLFHTYKSSFKMLLSDVEYQAEFNGANPRAKNLSSEKL